MRLGGRFNRLGIGCAALLCATSLSCSFVVDTENLSAGSAPAACVGKTLPSSPPNVSDGGTIEFTSALRSLDLGENASSEIPIGLNLDGLCTCPEQAVQCKNPISPSLVACDGREGADNTSSAIVKALLTTDADFTGSAYYSGGADSGYFSLLFHVSGYNGLDSDPLVSVSMYESPGYNPQGTGIQAPFWTGQEAWTVSSASLKDGASLGQPLFRDDKAFVTGGMLVSSFQTLTFGLAGEKGFLRIGLQNVRMSAHIVQPIGSIGYHLSDGLIAGVFPESEVFRALSTFHASADVLCNDGGFFYNQTKKSICNSMDMITQSQSPGAACDASSFGMHFETFPIVLGAVTAPAAHAPSCSMNQDPQGDRCSN